MLWGPGTAPARTPISKQTTNLVTVMMVPLAVVIICYALFTFYMRSKFMERKQVCQVQCLPETLRLPSARQ